MRLHFGCGHSSILEAELQEIVDVVERACDLFVESLDINGFVDVLPDLYRPIVFRSQQILKMLQIDFDKRASDAHFFDVLRGLKVLKDPLETLS